MKQAVLRFGAIATLACLLPFASAHAQTPEATGEASGPARAVNADTLQVGGTYVFLYGVESVERGQRCYIEGVEWRCYEAAVRGLEVITGVADLTCTLYGEPDYLARWLGTCYVADTNVNEALIRAGWALDKRDETLDYVEAEEAAAADKIGLWQGLFQHPAEFREAEGIELDRP